MLFVILGAIIGALTRYGISLILPVAWQAVMTVNLVGTFILAMINFTWQSQWSINLKRFLSTGFCGSFTTLSAFNWQFVQLTKMSLVLGILYLLITMVGSLLMIFLARYIVNVFIKGDSI